MIRGQTSTLRKIALIIVLLSGIIIAHSLYNLYLVRSHYQQTQRLAIVQDATTHFSEALRNFMFERGRVNVVLSAENPITDANALFVDVRRTAAHEAFEKGFRSIEGGFPEEAQRLRQEYANIAALRGAVDEEARRTRAERDSRTRVEWFSSCTSFINSVIDTLESIGHHSSMDYLVLNYQQFALDSIRFRTVAGHESSVFTAALAGGQGLSRDEYREVWKMRGMSQQIWTRLEIQARIIASHPLSEALADVRHKYYERFRPAQDRLLELSLTGRLYEGASTEIAQLSIPALDSVFVIGDVARDGIAEEIRSAMAHAHRSLMVSTIQLVISLIVVVFAPLYLRGRFMHPLHRIIVALDELSVARLSRDVPYVGRRDEIGKLALGVRMLQTTAAEVELQSIEMNRLYTVLDTEMQNARDAHQRLLQQRLPQIKGVSLAAVHLPATFIGGDFSYAIQKGDLLICYVSDITGHGLEGTIFGLFAKGCIEAYLELVPEAEIVPEEILAYLDQQVHKAGYPSEYAVAIFLMVIHLATRTATYSSAGFQNSPVIVYKDGSMEAL